MNTGHSVTCTLHSLFNSVFGNGDTHCFVYKFLLWTEPEILYNIGISTLQLLYAEV